MSEVKRRSLFVTLFGVLGVAWFGLHAFEYVHARYDGLSTMVPLAPPLGLPELFQLMPHWASIALTVTIWLGLLGSFLLLLGDRASVIVLSLTVVTALVTGVWAGLAFVQGAAAIGNINPVFFGLGQAAVTVGIWLYARTAKRYGTL